MQQMMAMQQNSGNVSDEKENTGEQPPKGKRGRPPKQNKEEQ